MRFIVTQKLLSLADSFVIHDEYNNPVYNVEGKLFALGSKLKLYNMNGGEEIYIEQQLFKFLPEYHLYRKGHKLGVIKKEFTFLKPNFNIQATSGHYKLEGDFFSHNFNIIKGGKPVAQISKKFFAMRDSYTIDIVPGEDESFLLGICIVIDQVLHENNHNNN